MLRSFSAWATLGVFLTLFGCGSSDYPFADNFEKGLSKSWKVEQEGFKVEAVEGQLHIVGNVSQGAGKNCGLKTNAIYPCKDFSASVDLRVPKITGKSDPLIFLSAYSGDDNRAILYYPRFREGYMLQIWSDAPIIAQKSSKKRQEVKSEPKVVNAILGLLPAFGDEKKNFHKLRLDYDSKAKNITGYVDDLLIGSMDSPLTGSVGFELALKNTEPGMEVDVCFDNFSVVSPLPPPPAAPTESTEIVPETVLEPIEKEVLEKLDAGRQQEAEAILENAISSDRDLLDVVSLIQHPNADPAKILDARPDGYRDRQRKLFLFAACQRSRFDAENAIRFFRTAYEIDSTTPAGQCAVHVMALDTNALSIYGKNAVDKEFESFERLADKHADDIFIRWMLAVECRTWHRNEEGVKHYRKILEKWRTGPALVHQTFANLLDETKQYEEALAERKLTVKMEPSGWSFNGLASTLHYLGRLEEAEKAHARATQLDPLNAKYWSNWAYTLRDEGKYDEAIRKCEYSAKLAPDFMLTWYNWALCLEANGLKADALEKFEKALTLYPQDKNIPPKIEALKKELGK